MSDSERKAKISIGLYEEPEFHHLVKRERELSDRSGTPFSLVSISVSDPDDRIYLQEMIRIVLKRMRAIDEIGWMDDGHIGILLAGTDGGGSRIFSMDLADTFHRAGLRPSITVFHYPDPLVQQNSEEPEHPDSRDSFAPSPDDLQEIFATTVPRWKRMLDLIGGATGVLLFSPLFLLWPLYLAIVSPGPVFFRQKRVGYNGKSFSFLKFRTMHMNTTTHSHQEHLRGLISSEEPMQKLDDRKDPRIIPGGSLLRKLSLDEVPQFLNVLRGDMSLVGPRPCIPYEAEEYLHWHTHRFDLLPGMTGLWQVSGKNRLSFKEMIRLDIAYGQRLSLWEDLRIILATVPAIVRMVLDDRHENRQGNGRKGTVDQAISEN